MSDQSQSADPDRLLGRLWPTDFPSPRVELYAILDGARDPRIHARLATSTLEQRCLYSGRLAPELAEAAPWLVHMQPHAPFTREVLARGWGRSWGIWLHAAAGVDELRAHFRRFLQVRDERGRRLLFRYYDPRVLRAYLPTCTDAERDQLFGPIKSFYVESADGQSVLELTRSGTRAAAPARSP